MNVNLLSPWFASAMTLEDKARLRSMRQVLPGYLTLTASGAYGPYVATYTIDGLAPMRWVRPTIPELLDRVYRSGEALS